MSFDHRLAENHSTDHIGHSYMYQTGDPQDGQADARDPDSAHDSDPDDSGYGESLTSVATRLSAHLPTHEYRHGRRYHGLQAGAYNFPNDELEQARLDMLHYLFTTLMGDKLHLAPIPPDAAVLDIGTGTGTWPIAFGDANPAASVVGVDLSPIQPMWVPANVRFVVDDVEIDWADDMYDFIHCRYMAASVRDWPGLIRKMYRHLKPGGWLELAESENVVYASSADGSRQPLLPGHPLRRLMDGLSEACDRIGRPFDPAPSFRSWCETVGFVDIQQQEFPLPIGYWPQHPRSRELGSLMVVNFAEGVEAFTAALFTDVLGWKADEVRRLNEEVRDVVDGEGDDHLMFRYFVVTARKPL
ncbi:S-adenosyl-L-methionine-dependent methyltransferase [Emericellopsis atlantica]|uniref:S-adenosyl-L-methionine-dependent methyltransferase n=1 Tax=Emericellopsis atlantica TaxID=2614577 RepID=A0A9P7ZHG9_9HYPO|nr:S-adenosyl-L-methionine-dependent methyltransferase [Emericellopsis atlantica]KAG9252203.1 S-adenosyl-L-methionine-dependent methyltransferase [Emericellopsis atlantica]